uniref:16S/18S rRNA aminocarboxypropyltransferase Tsr3 C-terminal domain-containing protein n=2 Tax=Meloidogyne TaxID=189290 RepID=A0A914NKL1_MELIC
MEMLLNKALQAYKEGGKDAENVPLRLEEVRMRGRKRGMLGFIRQQKIGQRFPGILLTPTATSTLSPSDSKTILSKGLAVVDCAWNQLDKTAFHRAKIMIC